MLQKTHSIAGIVAVETVIMHYHQPLLSWESGAALLIGCLAGPLADVDKKGSTMAKIFLPISFILQLLRVKHRTFTHSLFFLAGLAALLTPLPLFFFWSFLLAYASHPLIDMFNEQGIALFWPWKKKFRLLPNLFSIKTGSNAEDSFRLVLVVVMVMLPIFYMMPEGIL